MAARLIRAWFENLCQLNPGAVITLMLCGIMLGAVIGVCMRKPPAADSQNFQPSSGQVHADCQPGALVASAAHPPEPCGELIAHGCGAYTETEYGQTSRSAYNILVPDLGGSSYRLKTIVKQ